MDAAVLTALSAVLGSLVGGAGSIATAWLTQRTQGRRESMRAAIARKEQLYSDFISQCSTLALDALMHSSMQKGELLVNVYALENRIRLTSSQPVVDAARGAIRQILELYVAPSVTPERLQEAALHLTTDPLKTFSEACRHELARLEAGARQPGYG
jgi:hypothetical protein